MYLIYFLGLIALVSTTTTTATTQGQKGKVPIRMVNGQVSGGNVTKTCPDERTICEDDETCCALNIGGFGCCDPDHSRCCGDGVHCCPNNRIKPKIHRISLTGSIGPAFTVNQLNRVNIDQFNQSSVNTECPGSSFVCPTESTCCKDGTGDWACCNLPNATCCSDGLHCCPAGYRCRLDIGKCVLTKKRKQFLPMPNAV